MKTLIVLAFCFLSLNAYSYNVIRCEQSCGKSSYNSEASSFFEKGGAAPLYVADPGSGAIRGYNWRYLSEPGFEHVKVPYEISVPVDVSQKYAQVQSAYYNLRSAYSTIVVPSNIADSPWDMTQYSATTNKVLDYVSSNISADTIFASYVQKWNVLSTIRPFDVPAIKIDVFFFAWDDVVGDMVESGRMTVELMGSTVGGRPLVKIIWSSVQDSEGNSVAENKKSFPVGGGESPYNIVRANYQDFVDAMARMGVSITAVTPPPQGIVTVVGCSSDGCKVIN